MNLCPTSKKGSSTVAAVRVLRPGSRSQKRKVPKHDSSPTPSLPNAAPSSSGRKRGEKNTTRVTLTADKHAKFEAWEQQRVRVAASKSAKDSQAERDKGMFYLFILQPIY